MPVHSAIACNLDYNALAAALPLFEQEKIGAIEWSFDTLFKQSAIPEWFSDLISEYSRHGRLVGHGVYFSIFSGKWLPEQQQWLDQLRTLSGRFQFDHITEHFGFLTGEDFHKGAPIGVPLTLSTLAIGIDRLKRIQDACQCPVGLENLAFSYSINEVRAHGEFLDKLVSPVNGFIILDLHNLYCQCHNFEIGFNEMLSLYPLDRVREIHISGGSWDNLIPEFGKVIRRDTHDDRVPEEVFELLSMAIPKLPNLKYVVLEQLGTALDLPGEQAAFREDFLRMDQIVKKAASKPGIHNNFFPELSLIYDQNPIEDTSLYAQQVQLSAILENALNVADARELLKKSPLANSEWQVENWNSYMLATAISIAQKWKEGFK